MHLKNCGKFRKRKNGVKFSRKVEKSHTKNVIKYSNALFAGKNCAKIKLTQVKLAKNLDFLKLLIYQGKTAEKFCSESSGRNC